MKTLEVVCSRIRRIHKPLLSIGATVSIREMTHWDDEEEIEGQPSQARNQGEATDNFEQNVNPTERIGHATILAMR